MAVNQRGYFTFTERQELQRLYNGGEMNVNVLAERFSASPSTIYRELDRGRIYKVNKAGKMQRKYSARLANETMCEALHRRGTKKRGA